MISLKKFCICCFSLDEETSEESSGRGHPLGGSIDNTNNIENFSEGIKIKSLMKTSDFPTLKLVVLESKTFDIGCEFSINQLGLESSSSKHGSVSIGSDKESNDIIISSSESGIGSKHMVIKFDKSFTNGFALKDLGQGSGTFIRIEKKTYLKHNQIISFGSSHMSVHLTHDPTLIELEFIDGPRKDEVFQFSLVDCPINFGRMNDCSIKFEDSSLSRYQCFLSYDVKWFIQDGDGNKSSTNGTWTFGEDFVDVHNGMVFKIAETWIKVMFRQVLLEFEN